MNRPSIPNFSFRERRESFLGVHQKDSGQAGMTNQRLIDRICVQILNNKEVVIEYQKVD
jgi:hypothetical protein